MATAAKEQPKDWVDDFAEDVDAAETGTKKGKKPKDSPGQQPLETSEGTIPLRLEKIERAAVKFHEAKEARLEAQEAEKEAKAVLAEVMQDEGVESYELRDLPGIQCYHKPVDKYKTGTKPVKGKTKDD